MQQLEEHVQERDEYLETFISAFGLTLNGNGEWENGEFIRGYNELADKFKDLIDHYNELVRAYNRYAMPPQPVGRPIAASEAQQAQVLQLRKRGLSLRGIADEMSLGLPTVRTIIDKSAGSDRTMAKRRQQLGLEPKPKDWRPATRARLPKRATVHLEKGRELLKEAKDLR